MYHKNLGISSVISLANSSVASLPFIFAATYILYIPFIAQYTNTHHATTITNDNSKAMIVDIIARMKMKGTISEDMFWGVRYYFIYSTNRRAPFSFKCSLSLNKVESHINSEAE